MTPIPYIISLAYLVDVMYKDVKYLQVWFPWANLGDITNFMLMFKQRSEYR